MKWHRTVSHQRQFEFQTTVLSRILSHNSQLQPATCDYSFSAATRSTSLISPLIFNMSDPNQNCGICFEDYSVVQGNVASPNDRHPSSNCRHAICLKCAIQHVLASNHTFCPFCRQIDAFAADFATSFEMDSSSVSPALDVILLEARATREAASISQRNAILSIAFQNGALMVIMEFRSSTHSPDLIRTEIVLGADEDEVFA